MLAPLVLVPHELGHEVPAFARPHVGVLQLLHDVRRRRVQACLEIHALCLTANYGSSRKCSDCYGHDYGHRRKRQVYAGQKDLPAPRPRVLGCHQEVGLCPITDYVSGCGMILRSRPNGPHELPVLPPTRGDLCIQHRNLPCGTVSSYLAERARGVIRGGGRLSNIVGIFLPAGIRYWDICVIPFLGVWARPSF